MRPISLLLISTVALVAAASAVRAADAVVPVPVKCGACVDNERDSDFAAAKLFARAARPASDADLAPDVRPQPVAQYAPAYEAQPYVPVVQNYGADYGYDRNYDDGYSLGSLSRGVQAVGTFAQRHPHLASIGSRIAAAYARHVGGVQAPAGY